MLAQTRSILSSGSCGPVRRASGARSQFYDFLQLAPSTGPPSNAAGVGARLSGTHFVAKNYSLVLSTSTLLNRTSTRSYAKLVKKVKKKTSVKTRKSAAESADAPIEMPEPLAAQVGLVTPRDLESWLQRGEEEAAAQKAAQKKAQVGEDDAEEGEYEAEGEEFDEDDLYDDEEAESPYAKYRWVDEDAKLERDEDGRIKKEPQEERKRKRSPPPYVPGRVMLNAEDWTSEKKDCLVEYVRKHGFGEGERQFGIVRRPRGLRHWGVQNVEDGREDRVNVYKIIWQWPGEEATGLDAEMAKKLTEPLKPLLSRTLTYLNPAEVWKYFITRRTKLKKRTRIIIPNLSTPRASAIHIMPPEQLLPTPRRRDMIKNREYLEQKEDEVDYISTSIAAQVLFSQLDKFVAKFEGKEVSSPVLDALPESVIKQLALDAEVIKNLSEAQRLYLAHSFMWENEDYFKSNAHRGFECREAQQVLDRLQSAEHMKKEQNTRSEFVAKLGRLMEQIQALDALNDADSPVVASLLNPLSSEISKDGTNLPKESVLNSKAVTFTFEEMQWLERLKNFALSGEDGEDEEISHEVLKPLGLGSRPHHAFQLLSKLSFLSPYDNPHVLRYQGPKAFPQSLENASLSLIEHADAKIIGLGLIDDAQEGQQEIGETEKTKSVSSSTSSSWSDLATSSLPSQKESSTSINQKSSDSKPKRRAGANSLFSFEEFSKTPEYQAELKEKERARIQAQREEDEYLLRDHDEDAARRHDFGEMTAFAIDNSTPHEIDDAISIEIDKDNKEWLWIHVSDVSRYIRVGSELDEEAKKRATSLYLPDASYGIFPDPIRQHLSLGGPDLTKPDLQFPHLWRESPSANAKLPKFGSASTVPYGSLSPTSDSQTFSKRHSLLNSSSSSSSSPSNSSNSGTSHHRGLDGSSPASLNSKKTSQKRKQPVLSFGALIDGGGKIEEWKVVNGLISNVEHVTFDQLNEILIPQEASDTNKHKLKRQLATGTASKREKYLLANSGWSPTGTSSSSPSVIETVKTEMEQEDIRQGKKDPKLWTSGKSLSERLDIALTPISERAGELKRKYHDVFIKLMDFATKRRAYRLERRATLSWQPKPEVTLEVHANGKSVKDALLTNLGASAHVAMSQDYNKNARGIVTEFMLLAGQVAGHFARANSIPVLYGAQETRKQDHERSLLDIAHHANILSVSTTYGGSSPSTPAEIIKNINLRRSLRPPTLTTAPTTHVANGLPIFVSVTSPLRKYIDLIAHYQIKAALRQTSTPFKLRDLHDIGTPLQAKMTETNAVSAQASRFWVLHCLQQLTLADPFRKFKALVIDSKDIKNTHEATLLLLDFGLETNITAPQLMLKGQTIHVRVDMINPFYDTLILKEVKTVPAKRRKP